MIRLQFNQLSADNLRFCENKENSEDLIISNLNSKAAEYQYIVW